MTRFSPSLLCSSFIAAAMLALGSCGGSSEAGPDEQAQAEQAVSEAASNEPGPPDTYQPYRCSTCGCRVFVGEAAYCNRPSCKHHWTEHQPPPP